TVLSPAFGSRPLYYPTLPIVRSQLPQWRQSVHMRFKFRMGPMTTDWRALVLSSLASGPRAQNQVLVRQKTGTSCWFAALEMRTYVTASAAITCVEHCRFPRSVAVQAEAQAALAGWPRRPHS